MFSPWYTVIQTCYKTSASIFCYVFLSNFLADSYKYLETSAASAKHQRCAHAQETERGAGCRLCWLDHNCPSIFNFKIMVRCCVSCPAHWELHCWQLCSWEGSMGAASLPCDLDVFLMIISPWKMFLPCPVAQICCCLYPATQRCDKIVKGSGFCFVSWLILLKSLDLWAVFKFQILSGFTLWGFH